MVDTFKIKTKAPAEGREQGAAVKKKKKKPQNQCNEKDEYGICKRIMYYL